jgi:hypothetical protein
MAKQKVQTVSLDKTDHIIWKESTYTKSPGGGGESAHLWGVMHRELSVTSARFNNPAYMDAGGSYQCGYDLRRRAGEKWRSRIR